MTRTFGRDGSMAPGSLPRPEPMAGARKLALRRPEPRPCRPERSEGLPSSGAKGPLLQNGVSGVAQVLRLEAQDDTRDRLIPHGVFSRPRDHLFRAIKPRAPSLEAVVLQQPRRADDAF